MRTRALIATAAAMGAALMAPVAAHAVTRYASPTGATTGDCTTEGTACTINRAVNGFGLTDEVIVLPGTHEVSSPVFVNGPYVHGQAGEDRPVISSNSGFNSAVQVYSGGRLADVNVQKIGGGFGALTISDGGSVERVRAATSIDFGAACYQGGGLLRDSVCVATGPNGQAVAASQAGGPASFSMKLRNVTAIATGTGSEGIAFSSGGAGISVTVDAKSVIAQGGDWDVFAANCNGGAGVAVTLANSNYSTVGTSSTGGCQPATITAAGTNGNQVAEPAFVDAGNGDFRQQPASPTIDGGIVDADSGSSDIEGQPRSFDGGSDIGADEFVLESPSITGISPAGPGNDNEPEIQGTTREDTTVAVFADAACTGASLASGDAEAFLDGLTVTVPDNSETALYVRATDPAGNNSACVGPVLYREVTPPAGGPVGAGPDPASAGQAKPKCKAKKGKKGKRKPCKKRKKRR